MKYLEGGIFQKLIFFMLLLSGKIEFYFNLVLEYIGRLFQGIHLLIQHILQPTHNFQCILCVNQARNSKLLYERQTDGVCWSVCIGVGRFVLIQHGFYWFCMDFGGFCRVWLGSYFSKRGQYIHIKCISIIYFLFYIILYILFTMVRPHSSFQFSNHNDINKKTS